MTTADEINFRYRCKVYNSDLVKYTNETHVDIVTEPVGARKWAVDAGLVGNKVDSTAKPCEDGITNLEKYAFGLSNKPTSYAENKLFTHKAENGKWKMTYPVRKTATDVDVVMHVSENLVDWTPIAPSSSESSGEFDVFTVERQISDSGKKFFIKYTVKEK